MIVANFSIPTGKIGVPRAARHTLKELSTPRWDD